MDYRYYVRRIRARQQIGDDEGVEKDCDRLASLTIEHLVDARWRAQHLNQECGRPEQSIDAYTRIIEQAPEWAEAYRLRGVILKSKKRYEEALADIGRAIELAPDNVYTTYARALVYMDMERFEEALADLDWCLEKNPKDGNSRWRKALALLRLGREEQALAVADEAIEIAPDSYVVILRRAILLWFVGRIDEALTTAERAVELAPENAWNYLYRAGIILSGGADCGRALADLATARKVSTDDPAVANGIAWFHAAFVYRQCPDGYDGVLALGLSRMAVEDTPRNTGYQGTRGMVLYRHDRFREAREALLRAVELRVPKPEPLGLFTLAMTEFQLDNRAEARRYYDRAVSRMNETYPRYPEYQLLREEAAELLGIQP
jgi:tetratricopeptide (TPR) repeat protein